MKAIIVGLLASTLLSSPVLADGEIADYEELTVSRMYAVQRHGSSSLFRLQSTQEVERRTLKSIIARPLEVVVEGPTDDLVLYVFSEIPALVGEDFGVKSARKVVLSGSGGEHFLMGALVLFDGAVNVENEERLNLKGVKLIDGIFIPVGLAATREAIDEAFAIYTALESGYRPPESPLPWEEHAPDPEELEEDSSNLESDTNWHYYFECKHAYSDERARLEDRCEERAHDCTLDNLTSDRLQDYLDCYGSLKEPLSCLGLSWLEGLKGAIKCSSQYATCMNNVYAWYLDCLETVCLTGARSHD